MAAIWISVRHSRGAYAYAAAISAPVTSPPMCPCQLMFCALRSGITNVKARLIAMSPTTHRASRLSRLPTTNVAPKRPNTAPDAPAVAR